MEKLSLILGSRGRPEKLKKCLESIRTTVSDFSNIELVIGIDDDDAEEQKVIQEFLPNCIMENKVLVFKQPYYLNDKFNFLAQNTKHNLVLAVSNDLQFKTPGWDKIIIDEFDLIPKDKIYLMWLNDGAGSEKLPRHYVIHKNYMNIIGNYSANLLIHYCSDNWIYEVTKSLGRQKYLKHIEVAHSSPCLTGKQEDMDKLIEHDMNNYFSIDRHTFENTAKYREYEVILLKKFIDDFKE